MDAFPTQQHPVPDPQSPNDPPQRTSKPWYRRWWAITLGVLLAIGVIANLGGGGQDTPAATAETSPTSPTPAPSLSLIHI